MHHLESSERLEEKESGSVETKFECHLVIEFGVKRVSEIILGPSLILCDCISIFKDCDTDHIQRNRRRPRLAASAVSTNGRFITVSPVWMQ